MTIKKIAAFLAPGALLLSSLAPAALAQNYNYENIEIHETHTANIENNNVNQSNDSQAKLFTFIDGRQEIPGPGDSDGFGIAKLRVNTDTGQICAMLRVLFIDQATAAHIHQGATGVAGPVVVALPTPDADGRANSCLSIDKTKAQEIIDHPSNYYVNIHNSAYPNGAIRGQL